MSDNPTHDISAIPVSPGGGTTVLGASWQEQDGVLRDLWMQNKTPQQIGEVLGRSVPAIMTRAARLGLPRRAAPGRKPGQRTLNPETASTEPRRAQPRTTALPPPTNQFPKTSLRFCLMCLRKFEPSGRHNRICATCKG